MNGNYVVEPSALGAATPKKGISTTFIAIGLLAGVGILGSLMQKESK